MRRGHLVAPLSLLALAIVLAGCSAVRTAKPAQNITGTYHLSSFRISTTPAAAPMGTGGTQMGMGGAQGAAPPELYAGLKQGATTTEKDVAAYSGSLKVGRDTWSRQVTINGRTQTETGNYGLNFVAPDRAQLMINTPMGQKTPQVSFKGREMIVEYPTVTLPDGSTIHEQYTWKKDSDTI